ncbi:hypothetical protein [Flagellimonas halotolerans]|uniref:Uncharacterized protein n=1 Tax=Flagellimonas halotolerans TaxID=3112164 RepID=A0ABU6ILN1_9FLAO|nr:MULTISPECIES: hypothetical protein [unclassified Allomuricauda]MEC3964143.1 hypothetical protein [Muricauda sp. SYSU M86414]MEC4264013.1 hypothetical protein [Muricauda sp. SYSU M84420]
MINQKKNNPKKKYLLQFSPFFWRLGNIRTETDNNDRQIPHVFNDSTESS